jgi:crotonobetainyl-CoA:carnitine CoA-transferase CaiB-like acyl-CoA transferase
MGALDGVLVVDLSRAVAGPHAAMMLGDLGARVIKVESPGGDDSRQWGPPFVDGESTYFLSVNRNKESVVLDLKTDDGRAVLDTLVARADVIIENFKVGTLARLGFSEERIRELNPRAVLLSITGFGHDGPEAARAGYDQIAQGEAGLMSVTGSGVHDPQRVGVPISDVLAGLYGAFGIVAALYDREKSGVGTTVRTSLLAATVGAHVYQGTAQTVGHVTGQPRGNHHPSLAPYGLFHASDGPIQIAVGTDTQWAALCAVLGIEQAEKFSTNSLRVTRHGELVEVLNAALASRTSADVLAELETAGVPAGKIRSMDEVYAWDQTRSQGLVIDVDHATLGTIEIPGPALRWFDGSGEITPTRHRAPPTLGQHTDDVLAWLADD